jgi:hypothetical protein
MLTHNDLEAIAAHRDQAFALCAWLDGQIDDDTLVDITPPEIVLLVFQVDAQQVQALLRRKLRAQLPPVLVTRVFGPLYDQKELIVLFRQLQQGFTLPQLLQTLYQVYEALGFRAPPREELQALGTMLRHTEHRALRLVYVCWTGQRKQLRQELESLREDEYRQWVETVLRCVSGSHWHVSSLEGERHFCNCPWHLGGVGGGAPGAYSRRLLAHRGARSRMLSETATRSLLAPLVSASAPAFPLGD